MISLAKIELSVVVELGNMNMMLEEDLKSSRVNNIAFRTNLVKVKG